MPRRTVITGLGTVSALGVGVDTFWEGLVQGRSALRRISRFDPAGFRSQLGGEVPDFAVKDYVPKSYRKATKVMARDIELAVAAAKCAVESAGLVTRGTLDTAEGAEAPATTYRSERMGCHIGAGLIAAETDEMSDAMATARAESGAFSLRAWGGEGGQGMEALTPLWLLKYLPNMLACHVTIIHGAEGPSNTITCSEASGLLSIGESMRVIERGAADLCFSGSAESKMNVMGMLRLDFARRLAHTGDAQDSTPFTRPFDPASTGGILGEGGGIAILESAETAAARSAPVFAELVGFGGGQSDAFYQTGDSDEGYRSAVENALDDAGITPDQVSFIVPLASGVPALDAAEAGAFRAVFRDRLASIPLLTITPNVGNCVAGAGGLQIAAAAMALKNRRLPARVHSGSPAPGLDVGPAPSHPAQVEYALVCSGSLGGQNAAVVLKAV